MTFVKTPRAVTWRWPNECRGPGATTERVGCGPGGRAGDDVQGGGSGSVTLGKVTVGKRGRGGGRGGPGAAEVRGARGRKGILVVSIGSSCREATTKNIHRSPRPMRGRGKAPIRGMV